MYNVISKAFTLLTHTRQFSLQVATQWRSIASCKEDFLVWHHMCQTSLATKNCVASCRESRSSFYFWQCYATIYLQRVTPPLQLVSQFFEKEPITIRHNPNAAGIFKYSAGIKYNLIAGCQKKLRMSHILTATWNVFFGKNCIASCKDKLPRVT